MPIPVPEAVDESAALALGKGDAVGSLPRYLASSAMAGAFVGVAVVHVIHVLQGVARGFSELSGILCAFGASLAGFRG